MNLAIGTVILFLIFIPGISFRSCFYFGDLTKKYSKTSAFDDFIWAIIPGVIIQLFFAWVINKWHPYGYRVNIETLGVLLSGAKDSDIRAEYLNLEKFTGSILLYNIILTIFGGSVGYSFRKIIRINQLDLKSKIFRFNNEWFYLLKGEFVFFGENKGERINRIDSCFIDSLVKVNGEYYIYLGFIHSFYLTKSGELESIVITGALRRKFNDDGGKNYYKIPSTILVLKNSDIVNINVRVSEIPDALPSIEQQTEGESLPISVA